MITSVAAAVCALAFFRVWVVFSADLGGPAQVGLSGVQLAKEMGRSPVWPYVTPVLLLVILFLSFVRLFTKAKAYRKIFGLLLPVFCLVLVVWPIHAAGHILARLRVTSGNPRIDHTGWWWLYCLGLGVVIIVGAAELVASFRINPARS